MKSFAIVGYTFNAETLHPICMVERYIAGGVLSPGARGMSAEDALDQAAEVAGVNREDEYSYDSDEFPKVVFADSVDEVEYCDSCGMTIILD